MKFIKSGQAANLVVDLIVDPEISITNNTLFYLSKVGETYEHDANLRVKSELHPYFVKFQAVS